MLMIIAVLSGLIAVLLGAYRQMCIVYSAEMSYNTPRLWNSRLARITTWLITATLSIFFGLVIATWIQINIGDFVGKFSFGVLLALRWLLSSIIGGVPAHKKVKEVQNNYLASEDYKEVEEFLNKN